MDPFILAAVLLERWVRDLLNSVDPDGAWCQGNTSFYELGPISADAAMSELRFGLEVKAENYPGSAGPGDAQRRQHISHLAY